MVRELQDPLFDVADTPVRTPPRTKPTGTSRPRWAKYHPVHPVKCDDCMLILALSKGDAPASRQARWRRVDADEDRLLCYAHAASRRAEDGMGDLPGVP